MKTIIIDVLLLLITCTLQIKSARGEEKTPSEYISKTSLICDQLDIDCEYKRASATFPKKQNLSHSKNAGAKLQTKIVEYLRRAGIHKKPNRVTSSDYRRTNEFSSWAGKRNPKIPPKNEFYGWGGKRSQEFNKWGKRSQEFKTWKDKHNPEFNTYEGQRSPEFDTWAGKRTPKFNTWGGKRFQEFDTLESERASKSKNFGIRGTSEDRVMGDERSPEFFSLGDDRTSDYSKPTSEFSTWGGKRSPELIAYGGTKRSIKKFNKWGKKRSPIKFHSWGGKRSVDNQEYYDSDPDDQVAPEFEILDKFPETLRDDNGDKILSFSLLQSLDTSPTECANC